MACWLVGLKSGLNEEFDVSRRVDLVARKTRVANAGWIKLPLPKVEEKLSQMILDKLTETYDVKVSQDELTQYLIQSAAQYGMSPQDFVNAIQQGNQLPAMVGEVARSKALVHALRDVKIVDTTGAADGAEAAGAAAAWATAPDGMLNE